MKSSEFDEIIEDSESRLKDLSTRMEAVKKEFIAAAIPFTVEWCKKAVDDSVARDSTRTKELSDKQLKAMKNESKSMLDSIPGVLYDVLKQEDLWPHLSGNIKDHLTRGTASYKYVEQVHKNVNVAFRPVFGLAGKILFDYGYLKSSKDTCWDRSHDGRLKWAIGYEWGPACTEKWRQYTNLLGQYVSEVENLIKQEKAKAETEAKERWEKV